MADWNDLHVAQGLDAVRQQLFAALEAANDDSQPLPAAPHLSAIPVNKVKGRIARPRTHRRGRRRAPMGSASARTTCCVTSG